ncbi:hypothetical protein HDG41_000485 [Paraburkholderia sp. JPY162]|uniref:Uncharacterized protein n=1 Tax=Paraburkholderia youngii TaxID=2782701 RepID=A0A7W8L155_9BURK|nr:hypothetical protein [Paraburkholderia youngii]
MRDDTRRSSTRQSNPARNSARCSASAASKQSASRPARRKATARAAIVGEGGELEHAAAILHPELGAPLRAAAEKGAARVPSAKKIGTLGTAIDVPLAHKDALRLLRGLFRW